MRSCRARVWRPRLVARVRASPGSRASLAASPSRKRPPGRRRSPQLGPAAGPDQRCRWRLSHRGDENVACARAASPRHWEWYGCLVTKQALLELPLPRAREVGRQEMGAAPQRAQGLRNPVSQPRRVRRRLLEVLGAVAGIPGDRARHGRVLDAGDFGDSTSASIRRSRARKRRAGIRRRRGWRSARQQPRARGFGRGPAGRVEPLELVCYQDDCVHIVNGKVVMALANARYKHGESACR